MNGSLVRVVLLGFMTIASALGVWAIHVSVARAIGPIGGVLAAIVASEGRRQAPTPRRRARSRFPNAPTGGCRRTDP